MTALGPPRPARLQIIEAAATCLHTEHGAFRADLPLNRFSADPDRARSQPTRRKYRRAAQLRRAQQEQIIS